MFSKVSGTSASPIPAPQASRCCVPALGTVAVSRGVTSRRWAGLEWAVGGGHHTKG